MIYESSSQASKSGTSLDYRETIMGIRPYVPGKPIDEVRRELGLHDIVKLASNENPLGPSPKAVQAIMANIGASHLYPDGNCYALRQALSRHLGVDGDNIIFGCGSDEVIRFIAETFVKPQDEVIVGGITFSQYEFVTRIIGGQLVVVPMAGLNYDLDAMAAAVTDRTKLVFIANPNNPTGAIVRRRELEAFLSRLPGRVITVLDEAYYEYVEDPDYPNSIDDYIKQGMNVISLRTFSKIYGLAGLRVGYGVAGKDIVSLLSRVRPPFNVTSLAQVAALAALADTEHVARSKRTNSAGLCYLYGEFDRMGLRYIRSQANFVLVDTGRDSKAVFGDLLRLGVIVRTGDIFGLPTWIRVSTGTAPENERFIDSLQKVLGR